ncbi:hypothetical protein ACP70R_002516 [Stipagrostis hirtigluma subsp. patula]
MLALVTLLSMKRRRPTRRQTVATSCTADGCTASEAKRKGGPCRQGGNSGGVKRMRSHLTLDRLPQDVLHQIFVLLPMQDAARAACVSRALLLTWRYYPELTFSNKTLGLNEQHTCIRGQMATDIIRKIDGVLQNRAGVWVKRLNFELQFFHNVQACYIDHWLDAATPGIEELTLELPRDEKVKYRFPLHFSWVHITTEESWLFLSNSLALEHLELLHCDDIACLKIPCTLQLLNFLRVSRCNMLQMIDSDAPNVSTFHYEGPIIPFSLGCSAQLKDVNISIYPWFNLFDHARTKLPTIAPNIETLVLLSADEIGVFSHLSSLPDEKFLHLKCLELVIVGPRTVEESAVQKSHLVIDPSELMQLPGHRHEHLKHVTITGFCPVVRLMELIFYILANAVSLQSLTLDNRIRGFEKDLVAYISQDTETRDFEEWWNNFGDNKEFLKYMRRGHPNPFWEAYLSHIAIRKYIVGRVPSSVELKILGAPPDDIISSVMAWERQWHGQV